jgi:hypothetical protein
VTGQVPLQRRRTGWRLTPPALALLGDRSTEGPPLHALTPDDVGWVVTPAGLAALEEWPANRIPTEPDGSHRPRSENGRLVRPAAVGAPYPGGGGEHGDDREVTR